MRHSALAPAPASPDVRTAERERRRTRVLKPTSLSLLPDALDITGGFSFDRVAPARDVT